jgi:hypothetical protein
VVGEAAPVLSRRRAAALGALLLGLALWDAGTGSLPALSDPWDVALTALVLIPATFATVWLALPLARARALAPCAAGLAALAVVLWLVGADAAFNVTKLAALTLAGFWFLTLFEALSWVVLVAVIVPWVDILSVYRGPTKVVVEQEPGLFETISIGFRLPGEESGARLGPPDVLFFALFLATAERFGLRVGWTWVAMTTGLGLTLVATYVFELGGLPALPAIALGFLLPNVDVWWRQGRARLGDARSRRGSERQS